MKAHEFLRKQIKEKDNVLFSAVSFKRAVEQRVKKKNYKWKDVGYKFYPSAFRTLNMCPKKYVEEDVHTPPDFPLPVIYKMEIGKVLHSLIQDQASSFDPEAMQMVLEDLCEAYLEALDVYIRNMYKKEAAGVAGLLYERPRELSDDLEKKLSNSWPEIPGYDDSGFSFRCDLVLYKNDLPAILDIKTTSIEPERWEYYKEGLPSPEHKLQVRFYKYFFNKHNYYNKKIREIGLGYVNLLLPAGSEGSEYEKWEDHGEDDPEVEELVERLGEHRRDWIESNGQSTRECGYSKCPKHKK